MTPVALELASSMAHLGSVVRCSWYALEVGGTFMRSSSASARWPAVVMLASHVVGVGAVASSVVMCSVLLGEWLVLRERGRFASSLAVAWCALSTSSRTHFVGLLGSATIVADIGGIGIAALLVILSLAVPSVTGFGNVYSFYMPGVRCARGFAPPVPGPGAQG